MSMKICRSYPENLDAAFVEVAKRDSAHGVVLFLRGATSYQGPDGGRHISPANAAQAEAFGALLKGVLSRVICSPATTSQQIALLITAGAGCAPPEADPELNDPSLYVEDEQSLWAAIRWLPIEQKRQVVLDGILRGPAEWTARNPRDAAQRIISKIVAAMVPQRVAVIVVPGVQIAATVAFALGLEQTIGHSDGPSEMLQGAVFSRDADGRLSIRMGKHSGTSILTTDPE